MSKYTVIPDPTYGYLRADPIPSQEEVDRYYRDEFYSTTYKQFNDSSLKVQQEERDFFKAHRDNLCRVINKYYGALEGHSLFDIGFGFAQALLHFRERGLAVSGLEPSPEGVEYARSQGLEVYQAGIEDFTCVGGRRFEIVTLMNVLEHVRAPAETLVNIRKQLLAPKGLLVIDVPNEFNDFQTIADAEYHLSQWWVCPPNHINYFSATSLTKLVEACGYETYYAESSFPLELFMLMGDVYVGNPETGKECHRRRVQFEALMRKHGREEKLHHLYQALARLDLGRQVVLFAAPKGN